VATGSSEVEAGQAIEPIIAALQAGEAPEENFRRLFLVYHRPVYGFFSRRGLPPDACQDLTQETFLGIYRGMGTFRMGMPFDAWLFTLATNVYRKRLRRERAGRRRGEEVPFETDPETDSRPGGSRAETIAASDLGPGEDSLRSERARLLREAVEGLPDQMRACLVLRVYHDLKYREIAVAMGLSIDTVKAHLFQARQRLRAGLGDYFLPPDDAAEETP
jgi:RNA polymerase sigma-70 factor (ECF subfamily)